MEQRQFSKGSTTPIKRWCFTFFLVLAGATCALAQKPMFKVLAVTGKVSVGKPGVKQNPLRVADELSGNEVLQVPAGGRVHLICSNYQSLTVSRIGKWEVAQLEKECSKSQKSTMVKYFRYVWENLLHKHVQPESAPMTFMRNKAAVSRGCQGIQVPYPTDTLRLVQHPWQFQWNNIGDKVTVSLYDSEYEGSRTYTATPKEPNLQSSAFHDQLSEENLSYLEITPEKGNRCPRFPILKVSQEDFDDLMRGYEAEMPEIGTSAYFFTRSLIETDLNFLAEALVDLQKAVALDPANQVYKDHLSLFKKTFHVN